MFAKAFLVGIGNPFPNDKLKTLKFKQFADDNFKFDENGKNFSKRVENTIGKAEIPHYEHFLLFPQCFPSNHTTNFNF